jgi:hypothetical protein
MSVKVKFKVSDKLVKARDGANYDIKNYTEGVDYVMRGCFKGQKAVFRADILGDEIVENRTSEVVDEFEAMQQAGKKVTLEYREPATEQRATLELDEKGLRIVFPSQPEITAEEWRAPAPVAEVKPVDQVSEAKIKQIYPNFKWVETDKGRVWVGLKGQHMKRGQVIKVKDGQLYLGKTSSSGSLVKL